MTKYKTLKPGEVGLIKQTEDGRIIQVGVTKEQSEQLQMFLSIISQSSPLVEMDEEWDLEFKNLTK